MEDFFVREVFKVSFARVLEDFVARLKELRRWIKFLKVMVKFT